MNCSNKYISVLILVFLSLACRSQNNVNSDYSFTPMSPNVSAFAKYNITPVNEYTGVPNIGIPIYNIESNNLKLPISLNYHAGGIRVQEEASWVGLGWSLNAGGLITQTIKGKDDFALNGFGSDQNNPVQYPGFTISNNFGYYPLDCNTCSVGSNCYSCICPFINQFTNCGLESFEDYMYFHPSYIDKDWESDLYTFNFNGNSGKFILSSNGDIKILDNSDFKIVKGDILDNSGIELAFTIVTPDGTKYLFDVIEETTTHISEGIPRVLVRSFYLKKVLDVQGSIISFLYDQLNEREEFSSYSENYTVLNANNNSNNCGLHPDLLVNPYLVPTSFYSRSSTKPIVLSEINFLNGSINFHTESREDIIDYPKLNDIQVVINNEELFSFEFEYEYFNSNGTNIDFEFPIITNHILDKRLKLIEFQKTNGNLNEPPYVFKYNEEVSLPRKNSFSRDYWGYYNGIENTSLIPSGQFYYQHLMSSNFNNKVWFEGADRRSEEEFAKIGLLNEITNPLGAIQVFDYELNSFSNFTLEGLDNLNFTNIPYKSAHDNNQFPNNLNVTDFPINAITKNVKFEITMDCPTCDPNQSGNSQDHVWVRIRNVWGGTPIDRYYTYNQIFTNGQNGFLTVYENLEPGHYEISANYPDVYQNDGISQIVARYHNFNSVEEKKGAGLRIKNITDSKGLNIEYEYIQNKISSGKLLIPNMNIQNRERNLRITNSSSTDPFYCDVILPPGCDNQCATHPSMTYCAYPKEGGCLDFYILELSSNSFLSPSHSFQGNYVGYSKVAKKIGNEKYGSIISDFINEEDVIPYSLRIQGIPSINKFGNGLLTRRESFNSEGNTVKLEHLNYSSDQKSLHRNIVLNREPFSKHPQGKYINSSIAWYNTPIMDHKLEEVISETFDLKGNNSITTTTTYNYDPLERHNFPISTSITDGTLTKTSTVKYAHEMNDNLLLNNYMIGVPLETLINNGEGGGSKVEFAAFGSSVFPKKAYTANNDGSWKLQTTLFYNSQSVPFPNEMKSRSLNFNQVFTWGTGNDKGLLKTLKYENRINEYQYDNLRRLNWQKDFTGIITEYDYDELSRLNLKIEGNGRQITEYEYKIQFAYGLENIINQTLSFTNLPPLNTVSKFDAFGRSIEVKQVAFLQNGGDYITSTTYDPLSRTETTTDPGIGGTTSYMYEQSPLSRMLETIPASSSKSIIFDHLIEGGNFVEEITDENGNVSQQHTDIFGRNKKSIQAKGDLDLETSYDYNDRDQVTFIHPPGGGASYGYTYYPDGLLQSKTIPDKGTHQYTYYPTDQIKTESLPNGNLLETFYEPLYNDFVDRVEKNGQIINDYTQFGITGWVNDEDVYVKDYSTGVAGYISTNYTYDDIGRVTISDANKSIIDGMTLNVTNIYDDANNIINMTHSSHGPDGNSVNYSTDYSYPKGIRLAKSEMNFNGASIELNNHTYNQNDWLSGKSIGNGIQDIFYGYHPRGWLNAINSVDQTFDEDPCTDHAPEECEDDTFRVGHITVSYNCDKLVNQVPTSITVTIRDQEFDQTGFEQTHHIPLYGFTGSHESETVNHHDFYFNAQTSNTDISSYVLQELSDCLQEEQAFAMSMQQNVSNSINNIIAQAAAGPVFAGKLFGMQIYYDQGNPDLNADPQYNGNISWMKWRVKGEEVMAYGFKYDGADRLLNANYGTSDPNCNLVPQPHYDMEASYDARGNITSLNRQGFKGYSAPDVPIYDGIDKLSYTYSGGSNLLSNVTDGNYDPSNDRGFKFGSANYTYDNTGNLMSDSGKGINSITYTYNDMPGVIATNGGAIYNTYDAYGVKHKSVITAAGDPPITYHYNGSVEYKNSKIQSVFHDEGRYVYIRDEFGNLEKEYFEWHLKDHLGNTRVRFADTDGNGEIEVDEDLPEEDELLASSHYYPFGMNMEGVWAAHAGEENKYLYNGKELIENLDLGLYDYGARYYDPQIGRWTTLDKLADHSNQVDKSPYAYAWNDPITITDPDGNCPICPAIPFIFPAAEAAFAAVVATVTTALVIETVDNISDMTEAPSTSTPNPGGNGLDIMDALAQEGFSEAYEMTTEATQDVLYVANHFMDTLDIGSTEENVVLMKKGPKDLVQEAKDSQAKKDASEDRKQKREAQSRSGQTGGRSNQDVRGSHHTQSKGKGAGGDRHAKRNKRSNREQKNATQSKKNGQS